MWGVAAGTEAEKLRLWEIYDRTRARPHAEEVLEALWKVARDEVENIDLILLDTPIIEPDYPEDFPGGYMDDQWARIAANLCYAWPEKSAEIMSLLFWYIGPDLNN
jgi:hypothetical protein